MNCLPPGLLAITLLLGASARAAEPEPATPAAPATQSAKPADAPQPDTTQPEQKTTDADERFKPSEKISEDLSVAFPADI